MKRKYISMLLSLSLMIGLGITAMGNTLKINTYADTNTVFTADDYTNSDYLLKADGSISTRKILDFATDIKSAASNADCSEITQVR